MLKLRQTLADIDKQQQVYRILLNRSRYKLSLEQETWERAAVSYSDGKRVRDAAQRTMLIKERQGTLQAFETVRLNMQASNTPNLTVPEIMDWQKQMLEATEPHAVGQFRHGRAYWLLSTMIFSNWEKIPYLMDRLVDGINKQHVPAFYWEEKPNKDFQDVSRHPVVNAIEANYNLVAIHPFQDGNKRTARLLTAWVLGRNEYIPLCIHDPATYVDCIELYNQTRSPHSFYGFLFDEMQTSYDDAIKAVKAMEKTIVPGSGSKAKTRRSGKPGRSGR